MRQFIKGGQEWYDEHDLAVAHSCGIERGRILVWDELRDLIDKHDLIVPTELAERIFPTVNVNVSIERANRRKKSNELLQPVDLWSSDHE